MTLFLSRSQAPGSPLTPRLPDPAALLFSGLTDFPDSPNDVITIHPAAQLRQALWNGTQNWDREEGEWAVGRVLPSPRKFIITSWKTAAAMKTLHLVWTVAEVALLRAESHTGSSTFLA
ncbi:hypothetical protein AAFF_G00061300 [Aldrovandia affinis]|uniref:Uncharacterized protein n=1 Tax=Aldrovandia affinis TaxID=143900 RepID=A0AAD7S032_9TELE|nr:hypothetical protein AAFF_G00061300 [Aldrovandia affinis]